MFLAWAEIKTVLRLISFGTNPANNGEITFNGTKFLAKEGGTVKDLIANAQSLGDLTNGLTSKTPLVDADFVPVMDSAASNIWKKWSFANIKANLKTYFDTVYTRAALNYWISASSRLSFNGGIGIGTSSLASASIYISKPIIGGTAAYGIYSLSEVDNSVTSAAYGQYTSISTKASAFTLGLLVHNRTGQGTIGAGSTVTDQYGIWVDATLVGATNNYALRCQIPAGTNRWNLYIDGTAKNYLAGDLELGSVLKLKSYTFSTLPASPQAGWRAYITDGAASPTWGGNASGGGSIKIPVFYDGTNWVYR